MSPKYAFLRVASAPSQVTSAANGVPAGGGSVCCASGAWLRPQAASSNRDAVTMRRNVLRLTACPHLASVRPAAAAVPCQPSHSSSPVPHPHPVVVSPPRNPCPPPPPPPPPPP